MIQNRNVVSICTTIQKLRSVFFKKVILLFRRDVLKRIKGDFK